MVATRPMAKNLENSDSNPELPSIQEWKECTGKGVSIALIDSGVDVSHPDLYGKIYRTYTPKKLGNKIVFKEAPSSDSSGHGTACAGIITSIAPDSQINCINVLGAGGFADGLTFLAGLEHAINRKYRIINLSLGTTVSQLILPLRDLLDRAYQAGCIVVAAANNLPVPSYPSVFSSSLISVSKSKETDPLKFSFQYGEVIELVAPGVNVKTAWLGGGYRNITGNSFACPHITGIIARILESDPNLTPFEVKSMLYRLAQENTNRAG